MISSRYFTLLAVLLLLSCDREKHARTTEEMNGGSPNGSARPDSGGGSKIRAVVTVDKFYEMKRPEFLEIASAKTPDAFMKAYARIRSMHPNEQSFRVGCIYFYQFDNMMSGLENGFKPPFQEWMRTMGKDLGRIIDRMLEQPDRPECNQVAILFAAKFGKTFEEGLTRESARRILMKTREKLKAFD